MSTKNLKFKKKYSVDISKTMMKKNMQFLFSYLKERKGIQKKIFWEYMDISNSTESRWYSRGAVPYKQLKKVINFFNLHLPLRITEEDLLHKDLKKIILTHEKLGLISDTRETYLNPQEWDLLSAYRRLDDIAKKRLVDFLRAIVFKTG